LERSGGLSGVARASLEGAWVLAAPGPGRDHGNLGGHGSGRAHPHRDRATADEPVRNSARAFRRGRACDPGIADGGPSVEQRDGRPRRDRGPAATQRAPRRSAEPAPVPPPGEGGSRSGHGTTARITQVRAGSGDTGWVGARADELVLSLEHRGYSVVGDLAELLPVGDAPAIDRTRPPRSFSRRPWPRWPSFSEQFAKDWSSMRGPDEKVKGGSTVGRVAGLPVVPGSAFGGAARRPRTGTGSPRR